MIFIFITLWFISIALYINGKRKISLLIYFFFLFDSFQLIPEDLIGVKSLDFSIAYIIVLFIYGFFRNHDFIPKNRITLLISLYILFITFISLISLFYYGIEISEILRTGRQNLLLLSYFIFRRLNRDEIISIINILFIVVLFQCCMFLYQTITGDAIMTGGINGGFKIGHFYRFYNVPFMLYFMVFYAIFSNPFKGMMKQMTIILMSITMFAPMHRSLSIMFVFIFLFGYLWKIGFFNSLKKVLLTIILILITIFTSTYFVSTRTLNDLQSVTEGDFLDFDDRKLDSESTLLFRLAHFYERYLAVTETTAGYWFGLGFMAEGSKYTNKNFDFIIGLDEDPKTDVIQVDTSDIAWSVLIIRYGIVGSIIYLIFYLCNILLTIKKRDDLFMIPVVCYMILIFAVSLTSDQFYNVKYLMIPLFLL